MALSGKRIRVAANEPPKMMMIGVDVVEHPQIATHQDQGDDDGGAGGQPQAGCDIH